MDVACDKCQAKFKIPDEKVPKDQAFNVTCPKCRNKISIDSRSGDSAPAKAAAPAAEPQAAKKKSLAEEVGSGSYDAGEKPFDFLAEGMETALLCEPDAAVRAKLKTALDNMGYHTTEPESAREVLKQMRFHDFDMVVINELFDTPNPDMNNVLRYIEQLPMYTRRNMFVALVTDRFRTMDNMATFNKSVNLMLNLKNIDDCEQILKRAVADNTTFYRVFKETMIKFGRT